MKFDFVIGNPPYQADVENEGDRANPVYDRFMDAAYEVADVVELIHPARFLFNAGQTSKTWNQKMLNDKHFRVLHYEENASIIFPNTDIKGGVAVTIRDANKEYGPIGTFTSYKELNTILNKVINTTREDCFLDKIVSSRGLYRFSTEFYEMYPNAVDIVGAGTGNMIVSNIFDKFPEPFSDKKKNDSDRYVLLLGRTNNKRISKYIRREYIIDNDYIDVYKVMLPEANGTGRFGETLSTPFVAMPEEGATDTFISIGLFRTLDEANNLLKYVKTRFLRALLGVNKATQHNPKSVWKSIPLQDFTLQSDIDWTKSISEIDHQFYKKYELTQEEIKFIETNVKEMV